MWNPRIGQDINSCEQRSSGKTSQRRVCWLSSIGIQHPFPTCSINAHITGARSLESAFFQTPSHSSFHYHSMVTNLWTKYGDSFDTSSNGIWHIVPERQHSQWTHSQSLLFHPFQQFPSMFPFIASISSMKFLEWFPCSLFAQKRTWELGPESQLYPQWEWLIRSSYN